MKFQLVKTTLQPLVPSVELWKSAKMMGKAQLAYPLPHPISQITAIHNKPITSLASIEKKVKKGKEKEKKFFLDKQESKKSNQKPSLKIIW